MAREPALSWAWVRSATAVSVDSVYLINAVFLFPQGGQQIAPHQPPPPEHVSPGGADGDDWEVTLYLPASFNYRDNYSYNPVGSSEPCCLQVLGCHFS